MYARYLKILSSAGSAVVLSLFAFVVWIGEKSGATMLPEDMATVQSGDANIVAEPVRSSLLGGHEDPANCA